MKKIIILTIAFMALNASAQFREIEDLISKGRQKGISIHIDSINKAMAYDAVSKTIADKDHKVNPTIISFNELFFDNANIPSISIDPVDIYSKFNEADTSIFIFVDLGGIFIDATNYTREAVAIQQFGMDIKNKVMQIKKQIAIDSMKKKIKFIETDLKKVTDELKYANQNIKSKTKGAAKDDEEVIETETKLIDAKAQIITIDSLIMVRNKEFNAFPLANLKSVNEARNTALNRNMKSRSNLIKENLRSEDKIVEYQTEILLNKSSLEVVKDDKKATKKLLKANQKMTSKIGEERINIALNAARIKVINTVIADDSTIVKTNEDSLNVFDEPGRKKELKQLAGKKAKLEGKTQKHNATIAENKIQSEQKKKEADSTSIKVEELKVRQARLAKELENARSRLIEIEKN